MDTKNYTEKLRDMILEKIKKIDLESSNWSEELLKWNDPSTKTEIIWFLKSLVEKKEYIDKAVAIADIYSKDPDPETGRDNLNDKIEKGEDINFIYTVRGTVPWLLQALIATLKTEYYSRILDITERLALDPIYYVRQQATVSLSLFVANLRATKNIDGTPFNFTAENKKRTFDLAFRMLNENRDLPRVLEHVVNVFDKLRFISEEQAKEALSIFCYNNKGLINPEYLTSHVVPLVMFFAEFRKKFDSSFDNTWFQDFLEKFIKDAKDSHLKSTLIWHTWRVVEEDASNYELVKRYIPLFFTNLSDHEPVGQMEFLVNWVLKASPLDGIDLYKTFLNHLNEKLQFSSTFKLWFIQTEEILGQIEKIDNSKISEILPLLKGLSLKGCHMGDERIIFPTDAVTK